MPDVNLSVYDDYELNGVITNFEGYMFVTTPKYVSQHGEVKGGVVIDGANGVVSTGQWNQVDARKKSLTLFNDCLKRQVSNFPNPSMVSCCMIDFKANGCSQDDVYSAGKELLDMFSSWCRDNDRAGACVLHFTQTGRPPHAHLLYKRLRGEHGAFQTYLTGE